MDITTALIGNRVTVSDDGNFLNVEGGGWAYLDVPGLPVQLQLVMGLILMAEQQEEITATEVLIGHAGPDGVLKDGMHSFLVAWPKPPNPVPGQPIVCPVAAPVSLDIFDEGRHTLVVFLEGSDQSRTTVPFAIRVVADAPAVEGNTNGD